MGRPSKIDRLPPEIRDAVDGLRLQGRTIDEILAHLRQMDLAVGEMPSRSGVGRHVQGLDKLAERIGRGRMIAEALQRPLGKAPESRQTRLNVELLHTAITDLMLKMADAAEDGRPIEMSAEEIHDLSKSLDHLARAAKSDAQLTFAVRDRVQAQEEVVDTASPPVEQADFRLPESGR